MLKAASLRTVLLTGGGGHIGSHTFFSNSDREVLGRLETVTGRRDQAEEGDVFVNEVLQRNRPATVIHFAGDKVVGESVAKPLKYSTKTSVVPSACYGRWTRCT